MNKLLKLKIKISEIDALIEKEIMDVALYLNLKNNIWKELEKVNKNLELQKEKMEDLIKTEPNLAEYLNLIEKIDFKRETLKSYINVLKGKKPSAHKKTLAEKVEGLLIDIREMEEKRDEMKKTVPVLMYIQETDELSKLQSMKETREIFFEKAQAKADDKNEAFRKLMITKDELKKQLRKESSKDRSL